jgi:hypothetical protein
VETPKRSDTVATIIGDAAETPRHKTDNSHADRPTHMQIDMPVQLRQDQRGDEGELMLKGPIAVLPAR